MIGKKIELQWQQEDWKTLSSA